MNLSRRQARTKRSPWLWAGQAFYLSAVLTYESTAFLPLMLAGAEATRRRLSGEELRPAVLTAIRDTLVRLLAP